MSERRIERRAFLQGAGLAALSAAGIVPTKPSQEQGAVPNSSGSEAAKLRAWVKLSVTYDNTKDGPPTYADVTKVAQAYVQAAPERMVWGSNWPHPNEPKKPDDAMLFDLLAQWAPSAVTRQRILVENPEILYGFARTG